MTSNLILALQITALGMGLVFGAILLLWLTMVILTAVAGEDSRASDSPEVDATAQTDSKLEVALIAVARALAEQASAAPRALQERPAAYISPWQLKMRVRQMSEKGRVRRR
jgi:Na+-transporting methylmalonyl-CoA/oxaloacetate decarboxylase gamma subunit